jgi:Baseplate J-like protein
MAKDRLSKLLNPSNTTLNGIDFVEIGNSCQTTLRVHFLNSVAVQGTLMPGSGATPNPAITGGETISTVAIQPIQPADWSTDVEGRPLLTLRVAAPGDFSFYTMTILSPALDPYYNHVQFSFKALCKSDLDCAPPTPPCPPLTGNAPPITYLAKDFESFQKALLDFSALNYPMWQERSEADFGVMFTEALASVADDLSYTQDRIAAEAFIETASERRSIVRLARLVDYEPRPATSSSVLLQFEVTAGPIPSGLLVSAPNPDGTTTDFETGTGLIDTTTLLLNTATYPVSPQWNRFAPNGCPNLCPYFWDDSHRCLPSGATEMWVRGQSFHFQAGQRLLIDTAAETSADAPTRELISLVSADELIDPLYNAPITHIVWSAGLSSNHDLLRTVLAGNLVPATQGRRYSDKFAIDQAPAGQSMPAAFVRTGPNQTTQYLYTLLNSPLVWLPQSDPAAAPYPEIIVSGQPADPSQPPVNWTWRRSLLQAQEFEQAYTIDPMNYIPMGENSDGSTSYEYNGNDGSTVRFGDDVFGSIPDSGSVFQITYRVGGGSVGNVAADTITKVSPAAADFVSAVTNPFAATGGADEETNQQVLRRAPQAFRAVTYRAVRPEDCEAAAETLPWVLRAGTVFRWTGSWLTIFTTADPQSSEQITADQRLALINLLNRYRMAGYESYVPAPVYVGIDLTVTVCVCPSAFAGDAEAAVISALSTATLPDGTAGFFALNNFTFGTPLERSALEAAIQAAYGVAGVLSIQYRERGITADWTDLPETIEVGSNQILRMDNDLSRPERGSLTVVTEGGK